MTPGGSHMHRYWLVLAVSPFDLRSLPPAAYGLPLAVTGFRVKAKSLRGTLISDSFLETPNYSCCGCGILIFLPDVTSGGLEGENARV